MDNFSKTGHVILNSNSNTARLPLANNDITTFQEALLNRVSEGLCVCHNTEEYPFVKFSVWNDKMTEITGYSLEDINQLGWYQTMYPDPDVRKRAIARMDEMRIGKDLISEEWIITTANEEKKIVEITTSVLYCSKGRTYVFAMINDVTEKKADELRKAKLRAQMARAEKMESLGLLAGGVAHDLNNMLGPVIGYAELLLDELRGDEKKVNKARQIMKSATDAAEVVQDLLTLARRGRCELRPTAFDELIRSILEAPWYQQLCEENPKVDFDLKIQATNNNILASEMHIKKALMNLVRNAVDAMPTGGSLKIKTARADVTDLPKEYESRSEQEYVRISIIDTGHGIESELIPKIFEPYYSKKPFSSSNGSGLGLAVVYGVLKDHNGVYNVNSVVGKGTEFTLFFPICSESAEKVEAHSTDIKGSETILVVDDDPLQREMAKDMLESLGYRVLMAENGHQALDVVIDRAVDVVMLDMIMDDEFDGLETYKEIRRLEPSLKTIIVTGYAETTRVHKACELGVLKCVKKPYSINSIGMILRDILS